MARPEPPGDRERKPDEFDDPDPRGEYFHVYPQFGREHVTDNFFGCWCKPTPAPGAPRVIIHNVFH